ncbi:MAG: hypothetical protein JNL41_06540 [Phenylobacterium sp.]|uniref:hypothetical protein n=1 Tax=Phenylobacterium sp. TaxID=1871053 RepID=UPI001A391322|nr:hypothetical protein [Phenylobacterium sp.]MBL8553920.1 hypothetical protein [Phenylobacterium sp.]
MGDPHALRAIGALLVTLVCSGCAVQIIDRREVRLVTPAQLDASAHDAVRLQRTLTLGAWAEGGAPVQSVGVGVRRTRRLDVPADCRLVIVAPTEASLQQVLQLDIVKEGKACAISDSPQSPR